jgi:hypothetical protein
MADNPMDFFNSLSAPPAPEAAPPASGLKRVQITKDDPASFFQDIAEPEAPKGDQYGQLETIGRHGFQGLTMGFGDEMRGLAKAGGDEYGVPTPTNMIKGLAKMGYERLFSDEHPAAETYKKTRDEERKALEESHTQHPITSTLSDVAGSLAVPGGELLQAGKLGARALRGALVSGVQGGIRGAGEAPELEDVPKSTAMGTAIGATIGAPVNALLGPRGANISQQALKQVADRYGVQLPYYMVSDSPVVQFYGKGMDQLPFVGGAITKAADRAKEGVKNIRDKIVEQGTGAPGATPTEARTLASQAAEAARDAFVQDAKKVSEKNYNAVTNAMSNPNFRAPPMNMMTEIADQAAKLQQYGGSPGGVLQKAVDAAQVRGGLTYEALKNLRTDLYRNYRTMEGRGGIDYADYVKIIGSITKDMENIIHQAGGPKAVKLWESANAQHGIGKDIGKELETAIGKTANAADTSPADTIFRNLSSVRPNIGEVKTLKNTMKPQEWEKVQAAAVAKMGADEAGNFSIQKFISANSKMADAGRDVLFGKAGTTSRDAYDAVLKLGSAVQNVERFANPSRTAPMMLGAGAALQVWNDWGEGKYFKPAAELGTGLTLAAILARPATARSATAFSKAMDKYLGTPAMWTAGKVPRAVEVAARNFAISLANSTGSDKKKMIDSFVAATPLWLQGQ